MCGKTNRNKYFAAGLLAVAIGMTGPAFANPAFIDDGTLNVCTDATFPPMEFMANASDTEPSGFDIDLAKALATKWNVDISFSVMDFNGLLPSLTAGRCDVVISGILVTEERLESFDAVPYFSTTGILIGKTGSSPVEIEGLSGKIVAVQSGTTYVERMENVNTILSEKGLEPATIQIYPKATDVTQQVELGRVFAGSSQDTELAFRETQSPGQFVRVYSFGASELFGVYFRKEDGDRSDVADAMQSLVDDGTIGKIAENWNFSAAQVATQQN